MPTVQALRERLEDGRMMSEEEINHWFISSEVERSRKFYGNDDDAARACVRRIADVFVAKYLSNPNEDEVPLRCKTRIVLIFSNFCLYKPVRSCIYDVLDNIGAILEEAIRVDAKRPFNSELGRMSEHVLVLLIRVTGYKLKAAYVHEFSDNNTQFAVQLLLAVLLKDPSYEPAVRCNTLTALLGFTQPQAFFSPSEAVQESSCEEFTKKINFILSLMLRLQTMEVVSNDLMTQLDESRSVSPLLHVSVCSTMRTVMNVFRFSTESSLQWRQHILLSTTLLESVVSPYIFKQSEVLQRGLAAQTPAIATDIVHGITLAFKFWSLCTFRMDRDGRETRFQCTSLVELLHFSIIPLAHDAAASNALMRMYVAMFLCMSTIGALDGERGLRRGALFPSLRSDSLRAQIEQFLRREVAPGGLHIIRAWHKELHQVDANVLVNRDSDTFAFFENFFGELEAQTQSQLQSQALAQAQAQAQAQALAQAQAQAQAQALAQAQAQAGPAAPLEPARHLADFPPVSQQAEGSAKIPNERAAAPVQSAQSISVVRREVVDGVDPALLCALTGNVMKNPVISPDGITFEKESIASWIRQNGSICPITGKELIFEKLLPNKEVAAKIMRQVIQQSMTSYNQEEQADLYDF